VIRARDIMTRQVLCLDPDAPLDQALWSFNVNEISGAPVRAADGRLIGVLSRTDLVDRARVHLEEPCSVADAMTPAVWSVPPDAPVADIIGMMVAKNIHRVLVVDGGRLEGIVTAMDVLRSQLRDRPS
jgi:CBS domain-containing protein